MLKNPFRRKKMPMVGGGPERVDDGSALGVNIETDPLDSTISILAGDKRRLPDEEMLMRELSGIDATRGFDITARRVVVKRILDLRKGKARAEGDDNEWLTRQ